MVGMGGAAAGPARWMPCCGGSAPKSGWNNLPLAAPVWVNPSSVKVAEGPNSLANITLANNNLAPIIVGLPTDQAVGVLQFEIYNDTPETTWVSFTTPAPTSVTYSKSLVKTGGSTANKTGSAANEAPCPIFSYTLTPSGSHSCTYSIQPSDNSGTISGSLSSGQASRKLQLHGRGSPGGGRWTTA